MIIYENSSTQIPALPKGIIRVYERRTGIFVGVEKWS